LPASTAHGARAPLRSRSGRFAEWLRQEPSAGKLLLAATALALVWANIDAGSYRSFWDTGTALGPSWLHLDLSLGEWAADGLLAVFFFLAGIEVKREFVTGRLSQKRAATLPIFAAIGGMVVPALVALAVSAGAAADGGAWAIPVATDAPLALGVLAVVARTAPPGVRVLLLSVAIVDDAIAITLIAALLTEGLSLPWLAAGLGLCAAYRVALKAGFDRAWLVWGLALAVWISIHASGVHATVAGVLLGVMTPVRAREGESTIAGERFERALLPFSAGFAVPVFALAATGISLGAATDAIRDEIALGVFCGLLIGKAVGVYGGARLAVWLRIGSLPTGTTWADALPVAALASIGYTVSLLIARLTLPDPAAQARASAAVLAASLVASLVAVVLLRLARRPTGD
jgi:Na+:H+ antiporter, NhaA family